MQYTYTEPNGQLAFAETSEYLRIPCTLHGFHNTETTAHESVSGRNVFLFRGVLDEHPDDRVCPVCGARMHVHAHNDLTLRHLPFGCSLTSVLFPRTQFLCPKCKATRSQAVPFKAEGHLITEELYNYARDLLASGEYNNKDVADLAGLGKNVVKEIDKKRLLDKYTVDGKSLRKPEKTARIIGIDEFKLHNGRRYATHIIDMENGHILWIGHGKKKQIVYDFIAHVGMEWMSHVEAIACDMNSDFQEAFEDTCEWVQPVFDHFHIVKNFNDKVVTEVRRDEQRRLYEAGDREAARALKRTKYILTSSRKTLQRKDQEAAEGKVLSKGSDLFNKEEVVRKPGYESKYDELLKENELLFTLDLIKEKLNEAYKQTQEPVMADMIMEIIDICRATKNKHLCWFARLLDTHFEGIIAHATYRISSGKIEGMNNKIKTIRRQGYGYPDDEYFFLKIIDSSRNTYVRNPASHKIND